MFEASRVVGWARLAAVDNKDNRRQVIFRPLERPADEAAGHLHAEVARVGDVTAAVGRQRIHQDEVRVVGLQLHPPALAAAEVAGPPDAPLRRDALRSSKYSTEKRTTAVSSLSPFQANGVHPTGAVAGAFRARVRLRKARATMGTTWSKPFAALPSIATSPQSVPEDTMTASTDLAAATTPLWNSRRRRRVASSFVRPVSGSHGGKVLWRRGNAAQGGAAFRAVRQF